MNDVTKLPKWAQQHIADLERERDQYKRTLETKFDEERQKMDEWVDHVFFDPFVRSSSMFGTKVFNTHSITLRLKNGMEVTMSPTQTSGQSGYDAARIDFDPRYKIQPSASNSIRIVE